MCFGKEEEFQFPADVFDETNQGESAYLLFYERKHKTHLTILNKEISTENITIPEEKNEINDLIEDYKKEKAQNTENKGDAEDPFEETIIQNTSNMDMKLIKVEEEKSKSQTYIIPKLEEKAQALLPKLKPRELYQDKGDNCWCSKCLFYDIDKKECFKLIPFHGLSVYIPPLLTAQVLEDNYIFQFEKYLLAPNFLDFLTGILDESEKCLKEKTLKIEIEDLNKLIEFSIRVIVTIYKTNSSHSDIMSYRDLAFSISNLLPHLPPTYSTHLLELLYSNEQYTRGITLIIRAESPDIREALKHLLIKALGVGLHNNQGEIILLGRDIRELVRVKEENLKILEFKPEIGPLTKEQMEGYVFVPESMSARYIYKFEEGLKKEWEIHKTKAAESVEFFNELLDIWIDSKEAAFFIQYEIIGKLLQMITETVGIGLTLGYGMSPLVHMVSKLVKVSNENPESELFKLSVGDLKHLTNEKFIARCLRSGFASAQYARCLAGMGKLDQGFESKLSRIIIEGLNNVKGEELQGFYEIMLYFLSTERRLEQILGYPSLIHNNDEYGLSRIDRFSDNTTEYISPLLQSTSYDSLLQIIYTNRRDNREYSLAGMHLLLKLSTNSKIIKEYIYKIPSPNVHSTNYLGWVAGFCRRNMDEITAFHLAMDTGEGGNLGILDMAKEVEEEVEVEGGGVGDMDINMDIYRYRGRYIQGSTRRQEMVREVGEDDVSGVLLRVYHITTDVLYFHLGIPNLKSYFYDM